MASSALVQKLRTALTVCEWRRVTLYTPAGVWNATSVHYAIGSVASICIMVIATLFNLILQLESYQILSAK